MSAGASSGRSLGTAPSISAATPTLSRPWERLVYDGHGRGASSRFVIFTRQRSASTTFVGLLNLHPEVVCRWEAFSSSFTSNKIRGFLGFANRSAQHAEIPEFVRRFWAACPRRACGFKVMPGHVRPIEKLHELFTAPHTRSILLERANVSAEYASWRRSMLTGNWGTSPDAQQERSANRSAFETAHARRARGCRGCDGAALAATAAQAANTSFRQFRQQHAQWFRQARAASPGGGPHELLHLYSENLTRSWDECNATMARAFAFLQLRPLRDNCDYTQAEANEPGRTCDIVNDPKCSMELWTAGASPAQPQDDGWSMASIVEALLG